MFISSTGIFDCEYNTLVQVYILTLLVFRVVQHSWVGTCAIWNMDSDILFSVRFLIIIELCDFESPLYPIMMISILPRCCSHNHRHHYVITVIINDRDGSWKGSCALPPKSLSHSQLLTNMTCNTIIIFHLVVILSSILIRSKNIGSRIQVALKKWLYDFLVHDIRLH